MTATHHLPYDSIVVMGKTYAPGGAPHQLQARAAMAVLFWQRSDGTIPIICTEGYDLPDRHLSGAEVVQYVALQAGVPSERIIAQPLVNCTAREVEAIRNILYHCDRRRPLVITHAYHVHRTHRYLHGVGVAAEVVACSPKHARQMCQDPFSDLIAQIERGQPGPLDQIREAGVELILNILHSFDPHGILEHQLANRVRGSEPAGSRSQSGERDTGAVFPYYSTSPFNKEGVNCHILPGEPE